MNLSNLIKNLLNLQKKVDTKLLPSQGLFYKEDFEIQVKNILEMDHETITKNTEQLVNGYPNNYTYTKNLAERYLERNRGNIRLIINRPTMIYGCVREPMPGWVD
jgi:nucleoside-diphosphate-sugar epimerase